MFRFFKNVEQSNSFHFTVKGNATDARFLVVYQLMDEEVLDDHEQCYLALTVFLQDEEYCLEQVYHFYTVVSIEWLRDETLFPLNIISTLSTNEEFLHVCRKYMDTAAGMETGNGTESSTT